MRPDPARTSEWGPRPECPFSGGSCTPRGGHARSLSVDIPLTPTPQRERESERPDVLGAQVRCQTPESGGREPDGPTSGVHHTRLAKGGRGRAHHTARPPWIDLQGPLRRGRLARLQYSRGAPCGKAAPPLYLRVVTLGPSLPRVWLESARPLPDLGRLRSEISPILSHVDHTWPASNEHWAHFHRVWLEIGYCQAGIDHIAATSARVGPMLTKLLPWSAKAVAISPGLARHRPAIRLALGQARANLRQSRWELDRMSRNSCQEGPDRTDSDQICPDIDGIA